MGTKFKDKITGFIAEFEYPVDIETTRANPAYEEVFEVKEIIEPIKRKNTTAKE
jgi:hypothetical protein